MKHLLAALLLASLSGTVLADDAAKPVGLGQDSAKEPPMLKNLKLTDPLVQQKYLNEPDMLRFLRATYSEACARGTLTKAVTMVKLDRQGKYTQVQKDAAKNLSDSQRIWKMSSYEMEALFGPGYLKSANYCDCMMKEVADTDLVNPKKGLEVIEKLPSSTQKTCERLAQEKTERQVANQKKD
ncbi:phosphodiesterase [Novimethylophilus kurashikiensis]|uniref:Phosphodiesterase n=2 Tax=Novimethylophilus kurashikiensis TaxID=1825523 RepID=A0A2R5F819_9PROT|nr:phosphodiesterase [Novimethylophilus kurashikiensis]